MEKDTDNSAPAPTAPTPTTEEAPPGEPPTPAPESVSNGGNDTIPTTEDASAEGATPESAGQAGEAKQAAPAENIPTRNQPEPSVIALTPTTPSASAGATADTRNDDEPPLPNSFIKNLLVKAGEKIQFNKKKKLEKIVALARQKGSVDNADVERLLRVSHPTASRYLSQLVKENKLKVSGRSVDSKYSLI